MASALHFSFRRIEVTDRKSRVHYLRKRRNFLRLTKHGVIAVAWLFVVTLLLDVASIAWGKVSGVAIFGIFAFIGPLFCFLVLLALGGVYAGFILVNMSWHGAKIASLGLLLFVLVFYGFEAYSRAGAHECKREEREPYIGERCMSSGDGGMVFRLYAAHSGELLAERDYQDRDGSELYWAENRVRYSFDAEDGEGFVGLPPTWWDRLRAKLP